jgi:hypothetical protein
MLNTLRIFLAIFLFGIIPSVDCAGAGAGDLPHDSIKGLVEDANRTVDKLLNDEFMRCIIELTKISDRRFLEGFINHTSKDTTVSGLLMRGEIPICIINKGISTLLFSCVCDSAPQEYRDEYMHELLTTYVNRPKETAICHVEFGSGWLKQLLIMVKCLVDLGFNNISLVGIDPLYKNRINKQYLDETFSYLVKKMIPSEAGTTISLSLLESEMAFIKNDDFFLQKPALIESDTDPIELNMDFIELNMDFIQKHKALFPRTRIPITSLGWIDADIYKGRKYIKAVNAAFFLLATILVPQDSDTKVVLAQSITLQPEIEATCIHHFFNSNLPDKRGRHQ